MSDRSNPAQLVRWAREVYRLIRAIAFGCLLLLHKAERRHTLKWITSMLQPGYLLRKPFPWIAFGAIDYLEQQPIAGRRVFEYGSGGSTLYWIERGAECVSIEHDSSWYDRLKCRLPEQVDYRLVAPSPPNDGQVPGRIDDPGAYLSSDPRYPGCSFHSYVTQIDQFPSEYFDLVVIDGRSRPSCIRHAVPKVKPGGMLIVDNADRPTYHKALREIKAFRKLSFHGAFPTLTGWGQTDVFIKDS